MSNETPAPDRSATGELVRFALIAALFGLAFNSVYTAVKPARRSDVHAVAPYDADGGCEGGRCRRCPNDNGGRCRPGDVGAVTPAAASK